MFTVCVPGITVSFTSAKVEGERLVAIPAGVELLPVQQFPGVVDRDPVSSHRVLGFISGPHYHLHQHTNTSTYHTASDYCRLYCSANAEPDRKKAIPQILLQACPVFVN